MKIWGKLVENTHTVQELTVEDYNRETRTHKIMSALDEICIKMNIGRPIWLEKNIDEFKKRKKTRFTADSFMEEIDFDYLELQVLEEDFW